MGLQAGQRSEKDRRETCASNWREPWIRHSLFPSSAGSRSGTFPPPLRRNSLYFPLIRPARKGELPPQFQKTLVEIPVFD